MAVKPGTETVLQSAKVWRDRSLLNAKSVFTEEHLWDTTHTSELERHFIEKPDYGNRKFIEKLADQLAPASPGAKRLAAEMLWVMMLFPSNVSREQKTNLVATVWEWSGEPFPREHPLVENGFGRGIGSGGVSYNNRRADELEFLIRLMQQWFSVPHQQQRDLARHLPFGFGEWMDHVPGSQSRQLRHMLLHLLYPDLYERVSSGTQKRKIVSVFGHLIEGDKSGFSSSELVAVDQRLLMIREVLMKRYPGQELDFYEPPLWEQWGEAPGREPESGDTRPAPVEQRKEPTDTTENIEIREEVEPPPEAYVEPPFTTIAERVRAKGLRITDQTLRSYHLALRPPRAFVVLTGVSGTGKSWLAEAYAEAVGARHLVVPVAPNWTTNEDLLGFLSPLSGRYQDTPFSLFVREASSHYERAQAAGVQPRPYHVILDEMNLARVEYYFARFLSAMEVRARHGHVPMDLAPGDRVLLAPNLCFVGTVNVDETTHGFADKVYDRAQVIEMEAPRDALVEHLAGRPYADDVLAVWDALAAVAPFAFRVLDEMARYHDDGRRMDAPWEELMDDQLLQKVLPRIRGSNPALNEALKRLEEITAPRFPRTHARARRMREAFERHGVVSFH
jgi:MoxR-like ATPase